MQELLFHLFQIYAIPGVVFGVVGASELIVVAEKPWTESIGKGVGLAFTWPVLLFAIGLEMYQDA